MKPLGWQIHSIGSTTENKLKFAIFLSSLILVAEIIGGFIANSLALLSDAGHVFVDVVALSLSWYGVRQAERPSSIHMTFGYHRIGVVVAIVNAIIIFAMAAVIVFEGYHRLQTPPEVNSKLMLSIAVIGLVVNGFVAFSLHKEQRTNLNVRSAFWHASGDALASIGVIVAGIIMLITDWFWADPVISIVIAFIIAVSGWRILKEGIRVILEAVPSHIKTEEMIHSLNEIDGVNDVHDVHIWSITPELHAMSCHVLIDDLSTSQAATIRSRIEDVLRQRFNINHTTIQMECEQCDANDLFCQLTFISGDEQEKPEPQ